jgi:hypothetical protein
MIHTMWLYFSVPVTPHGDVTGIVLELVALEGEMINARNNVITVNPDINLRSITAPVWRGATAI